MSFTGEEKTENHGILSLFAVAAWGQAQLTTEIMSTSSGQWRKHPVEIFESDTPLIVEKERASLLIREAPEK
jgi:hypothetical protein